MLILVRKVAKKTCIFCLTLIIMLATMAEGCSSEKCESQLEKQPMFVGKNVTNWKELEAYTGLQAVDRISGRFRKIAYILNYEQLAVNYNEGVDFQLRDKQVILCPQTEEFLYKNFTPLNVKYEKGSRPQLEQCVAQVTSGAKNQTEQMLAIMRFCRDLHKKAAPGATSAFGGTEEQLIARGDRLCETLGRLFVALCEVSDIPARIVMHDIGGHICAEAFVDGKWGYVDPTSGFYCKIDGKLASAWELYQNPKLLDKGCGQLAKDFSSRWDWKEWIQKCRDKYFNQQEVIGFQNYSLADASKYCYEIITAEQAKWAGLQKVNKIYRAVLNHVFGLADPEEIKKYFWFPHKDKDISLAMRTDGFSSWYEMKPPITVRQVEAKNVDPLIGSKVEILAWGLGPGSVYCFDTKVGDVFGENLTAADWKKCRKRDKWVYENIQQLIKEGTPPLKVIINRGHEIGKKVFAHMQMQHEYGPVGSWKWILLTGSFPKKHPEYRFIPRSILLDFKHKAVRDYKLAIMREAVVAGVDGLYLDFSVYPPFFKEGPWLPDGTRRPEIGEERANRIMTSFIRDIRSMVEEEAKRGNREIKLYLRMPARKSNWYGLDWRTWMNEGLIDAISLSQLAFGQTNGEVDRAEFDVRVEDFVELGRKTGCKVFGSMFFSLGLADTDPKPEHEKLGLKTYNKPKTPEMYYAQALMFQRSGVDGIFMDLAGTATNFFLYPDTEGKLFDLCQPEKVEFADKNYMADPYPWPKAIEGELGSNRANRLVHLRVADDIARAKKMGYKVDAKLKFYAVNLKSDEKITVYLNGREQAVVSGGAEVKSADKQKVLDIEKSLGGKHTYIKDWWKRGERTIKINADLLNCGENIVRYVYTRDPDSKSLEKMQIIWTEIILEYSKE